VNVGPDFIPPVYPFVLKPSSTFRLEAQSGTKAILIKSPVEWQLLDKKLLIEHVFFAQEYIAGASISVCFCSTADGRLAQGYATEKLHYSNMRTGTRVVTINRPDAIQLAAEFVRRTGFVGFGELEMLDSERGPVLLELNARPWGQVLMSHSLGIPILEMAVGLMSGQQFLECITSVTKPLEWVAWDSDLLFRRAQLRAGRPIRASVSSKQIYQYSLLRDPIPALVHALTMSRLGPARFLRKKRQ
jgi:predicted ATP-grasp superfamily ATP-dependent carboligase